MVNDNILLRVRRGDVTPYFISGLYRSTRAKFWSSSPSDVWLITDLGTWHFNGTAWATVNPGYAANTWPTALAGTAADDVWVATSSEIRHFDGTNWSAWTVPAGGGSIDDIVAMTRGTPYVLNGDYVYRWNGLSYVTLPTLSTWDPHRLWLSPTGTLFLQSYYCYSSWSSDQKLHKFDGTS